MNLSKTMSAVEYASYCALEEIDNEAAHQERVAEYVAQRANQIFEMRTANISDEDFILALEMLSTYPTVMTEIRKQLYAKDALFPHYLMGAIDGALRADSTDLARVEARAMFGDMPSLEHH
jgi:hypothetical protein